MAKLEKIDSWNEWHRAYEDQDSELYQRMLACRRQVVAAVDECPPGPVTVVSICGGQGLELIGALEDHPRRDDIRGRLVEIDPDNAAYARGWAQAAQLDGLEVVTGDASVSDAYAGLPPVDVVVISGVFGHIDGTERRGLIAFLRRLCRTGASLAWTSNRANDGPAESVRQMLAEESFSEVSFEDLPGDTYAFTVARHRFTGTPEPFGEPTRIFTFGSAFRRPRDDRA